MTYPRSHLVDPDGGYYHVGSRCVRRAWLCGTDPTTGHNFDHRRQWLEDRILQLAEIFAVDLCGYAVLSNHYHIVLKMDPHRVNNWKDEEVADKWIQVCPRTPLHPDAAARAEVRKAAMLEDKERLLVLRERLGSLSWFMGFINEPLARLANKEDRCKGRFWEARFSSQRLLDDNAVLASMVYVDLNPIRAGMTDDVVAKGEHTSLAKRTKESRPDVLLRPINQGSGPLPFDFSLADYTRLAEWTATAQQSTRPVNLSTATFPVTKEYWLGSYLPKPGHWQRAIGSGQALKEYAKEIGQRWIRTSSQHLRV